MYASQFQRFDPEESLRKYTEALEGQKDMIQLFFEYSLRLGIMPRSIKGIAVDVTPEISPLLSMLASIFLIDSRVEHFHHNERVLIHTGYRCGNGSHVYEYCPLGKKKFVRVNTHESLWSTVLNDQISVLGSKIYGSTGVDPHLFAGSFERSIQNTGLHPYDFELDREKYALGTMVYGAEMQASDKEQLAYMFNQFFESLQEGAPFIVVILQHKNLFPDIVFKNFMPIFNIEQKIFPEMQFTSHPYRVGDDEALVLIGRRC